MMEWQSALITQQNVQERDMRMSVTSRLGQTSSTDPASSGEVPVVEVGAGTPRAGHPGASVVGTADGSGRAGVVERDDARHRAEAAPGSRGTTVTVFAVTPPVPGLRASTQVLSTDVSSMVRAVPPLDALERSKETMRQFLAEQIDNQSVFAGHLAQMGMPVGSPADLRAMQRDVTSMVESMIRGEGLTIHPKDECGFKQKGMHRFAEHCERFGEVRYVRAQNPGELAKTVKLTVDELYPQFMVAPSISVATKQCGGKGVTNTLFISASQDDRYRVAFLSMARRTENHFYWAIIPKTTFDAATKSE